MKTRHLTLITLLCMALLAGISLIPDTATAETTSAEDTAKAGTYQITFDQAFPDAALGHSFGPWEPISDTKHQRICERDPSHVETEAHTWAQLEILRPVSTSHTGERLLKCTTCQKVIHDIIPKLKKNNTLSVKGKTVKLKAKKLKKKKKTISRKKALKVTGAQGKLTYTKVKVNKKKYSKKFTVNSKNGKITVKKGVKKGLYRVTVKVRAAGNSNYKPVTRTVTVKVRVK